MYQSCILSSGFSPQKFHKYILVNIGYATQILGYFIYLMKSYVLAHQILIDLLKLCKENSHDEVHSSLDWYDIETPCQK